MRRNLYLLLIGNILSHIGTGVTMLALPWLIVQEYGAKSYGYISICAVILSIFLLPYIGHIVDKFPRKKTLILIAICGFLITFSAAMGIFVRGNSYGLPLLIFLYIAGVVVYNFQFPTLFAFVQEVFPVTMYNRVNGLLEVQSQFAMMLSGGLAGMILGKVSLSTILFLDASTYFIAILFFVKLVYQPQNTLTPKTKNSIWEGFLFMRSYPYRYAFLLATLFPFTAVTAFNYLLPIHISNTLNSGPEVFGYAEILWALGAICAGLVIPKFLNKSHIQTVIVFCFVVFNISMLVNAINPFVFIFVINVFFMGWGNASIRVSRNTLMMQVVKNEQIGRVNTSLFMLGNILQITLIIIFTNTVEYMGTFYCFFILFLLLVASLYIMLRIKNKFTPLEHT